MACARVLPELTRAAKATHADLYIAHNLAALPAAVSAARKYRVNVGFDAEDFHSGMGEGTQVTALIEGIERTYLPQCDYLTAGSPQIAEAYAEKYRVVTPISILNVFPLEERPSKFRPSVRGALKLYWFSQTIGARRGLEDVIKAIGLLPECHIELHLRGEWQSGYQETLYELARSIGVASEKIIAHSPAPANEMVRLASEYEIGLGTEVTSEQNRNICLTNKVFTYLLAGNAVIATATKAQQTFVETIGEAGFCYDPGDVRALAEQLNHWHHNHNALESARRQAWKCGTELYNWDVEKHKFLAVVNNVLNRRSPI